MWDFLIGLMDNLPALQSEKNPVLAGLIGFLFGGIGLGIYFKSFTDFLMLLAFTIAASVTLGEAWMVAGATISGTYGYYRALTSNAKLAMPSVASV
jgi:hypothetical protein